jgi:hypothetical protein
LTEFDEKYFANQVSVESLKQDIGVKHLNHKDIPSRIFMHKAHLPSFTINSFNVVSDSADKEDYASIPNK